jgi:5'-nucleotidase
VINDASVKFNTPPKDTRTQIFYFNDLHGSIDGAERIKVAADSFSSSSNPDVAKFKFSAGDFFIGQNPKKNQLMTAFLNSINPDVATLGNHELDNATKELADLVKNTKSTYVASNLTISDTDSLKPLEKARKIVKSQIIEKNGEKYGVIGFLPSDYKKRVSIAAQRGCAGISVGDLETVKQQAREEIKKFQAQNINKIYALSHMGYDADVKIAQSVSGLDIIVGGHTHTELDGIKPGVNYFYSPSGEPVIITQAGKNGKYYGLLDVTWGPTGLVKSAFNKLYDTTNISKNLVLKYLENAYIGKSQVIGKVENDFKQILENQFTESPAASLVADAIRQKSGAQIAFSNIAGVKGDIKAGELTDRDIQGAMPYFNKVKTYKLSEKDIIEALNGSVQAVLNPPHRTGNLQVSGLRYTIGKDKKVKDVFLENSNRTLTKLNAVNPSPTANYTVVYNTYLEGGPEYLEMLNAPDKMIKTFDWNDTDATVEYVKSLNRPVSLAKDGRIKIEQ